MSHADSRRLASIAKGFANPHRINILYMLEKEDGLSLSEIVDKLRINFRTASEHSKKLVNAGLIKKSYYANTVQHTLTPLGQSVVSFLKIL